MEISLQVTDLICQRFRRSIISRQRWKRLANSMDSTKSDVGDVHFSLAGNIVDGSGAPDAGDHWTLLAFTVSAPGTATEDADPSLRTISVGNYDALFGQKSAEELEAEKQAEIAGGYLEQGNLYFWTTLSILIVAADSRRILRKEDSAEDRLT